MSPIYDSLVTLDHYENQTMKLRGGGAQYRGRRRRRRYVRGERKARTGEARQGKVRTGGMLKALIYE